MSGTAAPPGWDTTRECTEPSEHLFSRVPWVRFQKVSRSARRSKLSEGEVVARGFDAQHPGRVRRGLDQAAEWAAYIRAYAPRQFRSDQVLTYSPAAAITRSLPGARQTPFTTAKDAGREVTVHSPVIDHDDIGASRGLAAGDSSC